MSHEDFDTWSTLTVGFNYTKSLVICLTFYDYKNVTSYLCDNRKRRSNGYVGTPRCKINRLTPNHMQTLRRHVVCICAVPCRRTFQRCTGFHTRLRRTLSHIKRLKITPKYSLRFFNNSGSTFCPSKQKHPDIPTRQIKFVSTFVYTIFANTKIGCDLV